MGIRLVALDLDGTALDAHGQLQAGVCEAVARVRQDPEAFDLVLLDLTMPDLDGERTFLALREIRPGLRVLLSSGYDPREVARRFAAHGVCGFLAKPYDPDTLVSEVASALTDGDDDEAEPGLAG